MKIKDILFCIFISMTSVVFGQNNSSVKSIFDTKCVKCHSETGGAPFDLDTYEDITTRNNMISYVVQEGIMPPWPADKSFNQYDNANYLSEIEKEQIVQWLEKGAPIEDYVIDTLVEISPSSISETINQVLKLNLPEAFSIPNHNEETFAVFVLPLENKDTLWVSGIGYLPGNSGLTHHVRFMIDTTGLLRPDHGIMVGSDSEFGRLDVTLANYFFHGWLPGNFTTNYKNNQVKFIPPNADLILNVHYSPTIITRTDSPTVTLELTEKTDSTEIIRTLTIDERYISNPPFIIEENTEPIFYSRSTLIPYDIEILSVMPHMHLLGKSAKVFGISPEGDLMPFVDIPQWNFDWQFTYIFEDPFILSKNSIIYGEFKYDNTVNNVANPFNPPRDIQYGWGTNDEMMNIVIDYIIK